MAGSTTDDGAAAIAQPVPATAPLMRGLDFLRQPPPRRETPEAVPALAVSSPAVPLPFSDLLPDIDAEPLLASTPAASPSSPITSAGIPSPPLSVAAIPALPSRLPAGRYTQSTIRFARTRVPHIRLETSRPAADATPSATQEAGTSASASDPTPSTGSHSRLIPDPDALLAELKAKAEEQWVRKFPWLLIDQRPDGRPCMKCRLCMAHAPPKWQYGKYGNGGVDIQKQTMVKHSQSKKHEAAEDRQKQLDGLNAAQPSIVDFNDNQGADARLRQLMIVVLWICKSDASIAMFVSLVRLLYDLRTPHIPEKSPGSYQSEYGFKQITEALVVYLRAQQMKHIQQSPFVGIQLDESTDRRRGKHMIVYLTFLKNAKVVTEFFGHLTVERCDATSLLTLLLDHLEATAVDLNKISGISTDGASVMTGANRGLVAQLRARVPHLVPCHCIAHREALAAKDAANDCPDLEIVDKVVRSLADILGRSIVVDITKVAQLVENTCSILRSRYVEYGVNFGEDSKLLTEFLEEHGPKNKRMVTVEGIDGAGNPTAHTFKLHEKALSGQKSEGDMESCISLVTLFVQAIIRNLESRMESLNSLRGSKLFFPDAYPDSELIGARRKGSCLDSRACSTVITRIRHSTTA
ncbi:hypothetical protein CLOM_g12912 [Closterium sp. NIES-68]|nr:hypothetical protein CLOM_g12912 [Closterium sp. NIES-68]